MLSLHGAAIGQQVTVLLRDPSGAPVAGAEGFLRSEAEFRFAALADSVPPKFASVLPVDRWIKALSDAKGVLQFTAPDGQRIGAGSGMVRTAPGLGALMPRLHPGRAKRIVLQPLAAVTTATGSEQFTLFARATLADGSQVTLPPQTGSEVRLPAGDYEVWAHGADGWLWQRLEVQAGATALLAFAGEALRLEFGADAFVHPAGRVDVDLLAGANRRELLLRGAALMAPLVTWTGTMVTPPRVVPGPPTREVRAWPPPASRPGERERFTLPTDAPVAAALFGLLAGDAGDFRIVAASQHDGGVFELPLRPDGDAWLLLLARGHAAQAWPWSTTAAGSALPLQPGLPFAIDARESGGLPIVDLAVEYVPDGQAAARVLARTDAFGRATFGRVLGPGTLLVSDARYQNLDLELDRVPIEPLPIAVDRGGEVRGRVSFVGATDDAVAATTVVVSLRDTFGVLRPAQRTVQAASDGAFCFTGLPDDRDLVLFATATRAGRTWSGRTFVRSGDDVVELTLQNEDPTLLPGDGR